MGVLDGHTPGERRIDRSSTRAELITALGPLVEGGDQDTALDAAQAVEALKRGECAVTVDGVEWEADEG